MVLYSYITYLFAIVLGLAVFPFIPVTAAPIPSPAPQAQGLSLDFVLPDIGLSSRQFIKTNLPAIVPLLGLGPQNHQVASSGGASKAVRALLGLDQKGLQRRQLDKFTFISALLTDVGLVAPAGDD